MDGQVISEVDSSSEDFDDFLLGEESSVEPVDTQKQIYSLISKKDRVIQPYKDGIIHYKGKRKKKSKGQKENLITKDVKKLINKLNKPDLEF